MPSIGPYTYLLAMATRRHRVSTLSMWGSHALHTLVAKSCDSSVSLLAAPATTQSSDMTTPVPPFFLMRARRFSFVVLLFFSSGVRLHSCADSFSAFLVR